MASGLALDVVRLRARVCRASQPPPLSAPSTSALSLLHTEHLDAPPAIRPHPQGVPKLGSGFARIPAFNLQRVEDLRHTAWVALCEAQRHLQAETPECTFDLLLEVQDVHIPLESRATGMLQPTDCASRHSPRGRSWLACNEPCPCGSGC